MNFLIIGIIANKLLICFMIEVGNVFERNTIDKHQFIMEVVEVSNENVHFIMSHKGELDKFSYSMRRDVVLNLIKNNKMGKIN